MANIKLAIVDDQKLFREGLSLIIKTFDNIELIIEAENGQALLKFLEKKQPDVVLLDMEMPVMDGSETIKILKQKYPDIKVIFLSMHHDEHLIAHMMSLGANGYLLKDEDSNIVLKAIQTVIREGVFFNDYTSLALLNQVKGASQSGPTTFPGQKEIQFTNREKEILQLLSRGMSRKDMSNAQYVTEKAIDFHLQNLRKKTGSKSMAELVSYAIKNGYSG